MGKVFHHNKFQLTVADAERTRQKLDGVILETPLLPSKATSGVSFKPENLQVTGSFKIRPAYSQMIALTAEQLRAGIVTSSSGNFAQATAYAASLLGVSAKIVMMRSSNPVKVKRTQRFGGEVVFCDDRFEARAEEVARIRDAETRTEIFPYDHPEAVAGNASSGFEMIEQCPQVQHIVVPISGGGLISGIAWAVKEKRPDVLIWGVQPTGSNATFLSFQQGKPTSISKADTMADGLMVTQPGQLTFPLIQRYVHDVVQVEESSILHAVRVLAEEEKLVVEPSGAVTLAAVLGGKVPASNTTCFLSGGNISPEVLQAALDTPNPRRTTKAQTH
jgi:threonine dehydratase